MLLCSSPIFLFSEITFGTQDYDLDKFDDLEQKSLDKQTKKTEDPNENKQRLILYLLPGNYKVIFRSKSAKQYMYTTEKDFKVRSGKSELIKLY